MSYTKSNRKSGTRNINTTQNNRKKKKKKKRQDTDKTNKKKYEERDIGDAQKKMIITLKHLLKILTFVELQESIFLVIGCAWKK